MSRIFAQALRSGAGTLLTACVIFAAPPAPATEASMNQVPPDSLHFVVEVPERVDAAETVPIRLIIENTSETGVTLYLTGRPVAFDVEVTDAAGEIVWRRLEGEVVSMVLQLRELAPGERLVFETEWDQRTSAGRLVPPGAYRVRGLLPTDQREPLATPYVDLQIVQG
jgi:hypothetical protein